MTANEFYVANYHVWAGPGIRDADGWRDRYDSPDRPNATCRRCGSAVNDLTQHEEFHAKLNQMWGAAGLPLGTTVV